jgi:hypothetical protein
MHVEGPEPEGPHGKKISDDGRIHMDRQIIR